MATKVPLVPPDESSGHRRNKSSSVLKSIMVSKNHKRSPSDAAPLCSDRTENSRPVQQPHAPKAMPLLPSDHPHSQQRAVQSSRKAGNNPPSLQKPQDVKERPTRGLHKRTLSTVSLRSLGKDKEKSKDKTSREPSRTRADLNAKNNPQKTKSSTNLAAVFQKTKTLKEAKADNAPIDQENTTPPSSRAAEIYTPIWAQFSKQPFEVTTKTSVPLNDRRGVEQEIALYTPTEYSPSKQRNFYDYGQPSLQKCTGVKERPWSGILPSTSATSIMSTFSRKPSSDRAPLAATKGNELRSKEGHAQKGVMTRGTLRRTSSEGANSGSDQTKQTLAKKGARVMAAVAAFNGKVQDVGQDNLSPTKLDPRIVDADFEAVLESRNIPQHQRAQMRTLKLEIKADFVRTHKVETPVGTASKKQSHESAIGRPALGRSAKSKDGPGTEEASMTEPDISANSSKRSRPRSRTFTFSKSDSPTKKQKAGGSVVDSKSTNIPKSPSTRSLSSTSGSQGSSLFSKAPKAATPDEFVTYLRKTTRPQVVEVGKLHKLRLLLRNETVEWVDSFIRQGGMTELVVLLHRIMEVEWREEHEDTLMHEVLRCLKGVCTTDIALKNLCDMRSSLFPALLAMLFDEERKGPSEFTTRELIINLLFANLESASPRDLHARAVTLLSYLKDPVTEREAQTLPFITEMQQPRPYRVWCRELTNVTKEVFWIFIHHLNVFPKPPSPADQETQPHAQRYWPQPRQIVPAAPYVGGVEWEATNYIATHLDLLNGLLASFPTQASRNTLREEFRVSGFEKLMGHLRACNPKYYGAVHDSIKTWIASAAADDWDVKDVRMGPSDGKAPGSPVKSPAKSPKKVEKAPKLEAPKMGLGLDFNLDIDISKATNKKDPIIDDWI